MPSMKMLHDKHFQVMHTRARQAFVADSAPPVEVAFADVTAVTACTVCQYGTEPHQKYRGKITTGGLAGSTVELPFVGLNCTADRMGQGIWDTSFNIPGIVTAKTYTDDSCTSLSATETDIDVEFTVLPYHPDGPSIDVLAYFYASRLIFFHGTKLLCETDEPMVIDNLITAAGCYELNRVLNDTDTPEKFLALSYGGQATVTHKCPP